MRADERKFKQILLNLLSNAVKFTPDGGKVDVRARLGRRRAARWRWPTPASASRPDDQAAVFEEFKQVGRDYTNKHEGTGLGLALTKRFVELHGGALTLDSEPGKGSTFTFTLPSPSMKTILIVEDNEKNMKLVRDILRAKGYATLEAVNGLDGVTLALEHKPDLVLMDIQLPDINGIEAFERIRANADTAAIPVVAFTASVTADDRSRIGDAGFDGFLSKPINLKEFRRDGAAHAGREQRHEARAATILVVDDTPANVKLLVDVLTAKGYAVTSAASGEEALVRIGVSRPTWCCSTS